jgi:cytochrome oxidase assembly protein ShyY1
MVDLAMWLGGLAAVALLCLAAGWQVGRRHEKQRCKQRVALALSQVEGRHKRELNHWQAVLAEQAQQLKEARIKARMQDVHAQKPARSHHS